MRAPSPNRHRTGSQALDGRPPGGRPPGPRWSRDPIRAARIALLVPLLHNRGLQLIAREAANFELPAHPGVIIKDSYWRWPQRELAGNTIDFFVQVLGLTFHNAMREITAAQSGRREDNGRWRRSHATPAWPQLSVQ